MDSSGFRWPRGPGPRDSALPRPYQSLADVNHFRPAPHPPLDHHNAAASSYSDDSTSSDYSDTESSSGSSWSSERSVPEWESHVDAEGELFYVEFGSNTIPGPVQAPEGAEVGETQEISKQKSKSRLGHLLKRRRRKKSPQVPSRPDRPQQRVDIPPLEDWSEWISFTIELEVNPSTSGLRRNLCETLLGFVPGIPQPRSGWVHGEASLRQRVVVERVISGPLLQGSHIQTGDWLEKLNEKNVTHRDLNDILAAIHSREIVALNFRRRPPSSDSPSTGPQVNGSVHGLLLLSQEGIDEHSAELQDVLYRSHTTGLDQLLKWRGVGPTLTHLMPQLNSSAPVCSTVVLEESAINLAYVKEEQVLLLMAAPSTWCTAIQLQLMARQIELLLRFQYGSMRRALTEERYTDEIRRLVELVFQTLRTASGGRLSSVLPSSGQQLHVAADVHLDVMLTLHQMEAMDYEDWDDSRLNIERCVTIIGSCVHYQGYLLASTLSEWHVHQVGLLLKWNQLLEMSRRRRIKSLVLWRRVWPASPQPPCFLVVVGSGHILISAILECGGPCAPWDRNPDSFLIDEMQHYARELESLDLEAACNKILNGPENPALASNLAEDVDAAPDLNVASAFNITAGVKPTMINYLLMDFGTGVFIAPTGTNTSTKFMDQFQQTALSIHNLFQQTIQSKADLLRADWGGPWSDKNLIGLQEVCVVFTVNEASSKTCSDSFWVCGRLFAAPTHKELYVCYQEGVPQDLLDLAFHLALGAVL